MFLVVHRAVALSNKPGIFPVGKMPNRVFLTVFSLDYYEFKWSKLRISSAKPDFVGQSHVSATAPLYFRQRVFQAISSSFENDYFPVSNDIS